MLRIDVRSSRELQALLLSIRQANREVQKEIRQRTKPMVQSAWQSTLAQEATTRFEHRVLVDTARVAVSNQNVKLKAGGMAKKLSGGARAREVAHAAEFGANQDTMTRYGAISRRGRRYTVNRHSSRQLRPRKKSGYVVYPAAARVIPRLASLWTQTAIRTFLDQIDKR